MNEKEFIDEFVERGDFEQWYWFEWHDGGQIPILVVNISVVESGITMNSPMFKLPKDTMLDFKSLPGEILEYIPWPETEEEPEPESETEPEPESF